MAKKMKGQRGFTLSLTPFYPLFLLALVLPVLLIGITSQETFTLFSRASATPVLRVWLEPSTVIAHPGQAVPLSVMAELEGSGNLIPSLVLSVAGDSSLAIAPTRVQFAKPFGGKGVIGTVVITPRTSGPANVAIPHENVEIPGVSVSVVTGGTTVMVQ